MAFKANLNNWWPDPNASNAGAQEQQGNKKPQNSNVSLLEAHYLSHNDLASKWWLYKLWLEDNLLSTLPCRRWDEGMFHQFLRMTNSTLGEDVSFWWLDGSEDEMPQPHLTESSHQWGDYSKKKKSFQGLEGNLRKMGFIGEMKSQMEDGWKGNKGGRRREEIRQRLQKEN